jgi:hypothetical protein
MAWLQIKNIQQLAPPLVSSKTSPLKSKRERFSEGPQITDATEKLGITPQTDGNPV